MAVMSKEEIDKFYGSMTETLRTEIDWRFLFPGIQLGRHRDPRAAARQIAADVEKLRSCSEAGKLHIRQERCARAGFTVDGEPRFYIGKTGR